MVSTLMSSIGQSSATTRVLIEYYSIRKEVIVMLEAVLYRLEPETKVVRFTVRGKTYRTTARFNRLAAITKLFSFAIGFVVVVALYLMVSPIA